jgi:hypothetical protein
VRRRLLLEERLAVNAVGVARDGQRPAGKMRQQERRDRRVVVDHVTLGEAVGRIQDLRQVGQRELVAVEDHAGRCRSRLANDDAPG